MRTFTQNEPLTDAELVGLYSDFVPFHTISSLGYSEAAIGTRFSSSQRQFR